MCSSARRCLASSRTTCRTIASSRCACASRVTRARATHTLSTYRRRARRTTICGSTGCTLRATMVGGKMSLCVPSLFFPPPTCVSIIYRDGAQIPFDGFVMTKAGTINTQPVSMLRERVRSVGISLLGGNAGVEGPYELGIEKILAVNEEDVTVPPCTLPPFLFLFVSNLSSYSGQFDPPAGTKCRVGARANMIPLVGLCHSEICNIGNTLVRQRPLQPYRFSFSDT